MQGGMGEPQGPCYCQGTVCNNGFGWIMGKIQDLTGGFHSGRHVIEVCDMFPNEMLEWDAEDGLFLPPLPPGISNIETMKGFMTKFKGSAMDLQQGNAAIKSSEKALEDIGRGKTDGFRERHT